MFAASTTLIYIFTKIIIIIMSIRQRIGQYLTWQQCVQCPRSSLRLSAAFVIGDGGRGGCSIVMVIYIENGETIFNILSIDKV